MKNKSEIVAKYIEKLIITNQLKPGDKIPAEVKIAEELGLSRVSVRGGIAKLSAMGLLTQVRGGGTYVNKNNKEDYIKNFLPSMLFDKVDYLELLEFRQALDDLSVELCIKHFDNTLIDSLNYNIEQMEQATTSEDFFLYDKEFHLTITKFTKNSLIHRVNLLIWMVLEQHANNKYTIEESKTRIGEHKFIVEAIKNKDVNLAKQQSNQHVSKTIEDVHLLII